MRRAEAQRRIEKRDEDVSAEVDKAAQLEVDNAQGEDGRGRQRRAGPRGGVAQCGEGAEDAPGRFVLHGRADDERRPDADIAVER